MGKSERLFEMVAKRMLQYFSIATLIIVFGLFIYPGIYEFDKINQKNPVKINRITGHTQVLVADKWITVIDSDVTKPDEVALLKEELAKDREQLKKEMIAETRQGIVNEVLNEVTSELSAVKEEIAVYKTFQTDPSNYFSQGSTMDEVKSIMGAPTGISKYTFTDDETWSYGLSTVSFKNGRVDGYSNIGKNLHVR